MNSSLGEREPVGSMPTGLPSGSASVYAPPPAAPPGKAKDNWPSVIILLVAGGGLMMSLLLAAGLFGTGIYAVFSGQNAQVQTLASFSMGWAAVLVGLLLIPAIWYAIRALTGVKSAVTPAPARRPRWLSVAAGLLLLWPFLVWAGYLIGQRTNLDWLLLPPIQLLVIGIPLWLFVELGLRNISPGSPRRSWGILSFGLVVTPTLLILVELFVLLVLGSLAILWFTTQPGAAEEITRLSQRLLNSQMDPEVTMRVLRPYLQRPLVIYAILSIFAVVVPLLEEILKPLALWGLIGRRITPAEGFAAGLISGFAFGLFESLGMIANPSGEGWAFTVIGRVGTGLLHVSCAGLVGWGFASAWTHDHYARLGAILLIAISLHGLWNTFSIIMGLGPVFNSSAAISQPLIERLAGVAPFVLVVLTLTMLLILLGANRIIRRDAAVLASAV